MLFLQRPIPAESLAISSKSAYYPKSISGSRLFAEPARSLYVRSILSLSLSLCFWKSYRDVRAIKRYRARARSFVEDDVSRRQTGGMTGTLIGRTLRSSSMSNCRISGWFGRYEQRCVKRERYKCARVHERARARVYTCARQSVLSRGTARRDVSNVRLLTSFPGMGRRVEGQARWKGSCESRAEIRSPGNSFSICYRPCRCTNFFGVGSTWWSVLLTISWPVRSIKIRSARRAVPMSCKPLGLLAIIDIAPHTYTHTHIGCRSIRSRERERIFSCAKL